MRVSRRGSVVGWLLLPRRASRAAPGAAAPRPPRARARCGAPRRWSPRSVSACCVAAGAPPCCAPPARVAQLPPCVPAPGVVSPCRVGAAPRLGPCRGAGPPPRVGAALLSVVGWRRPLHRRGGAGRAGGAPFLGASRPPGGVDVGASNLDKGPLQSVNVCCIISLLHRTERWC